MKHYKTGDAPEFERDFCCWTRANCHMCLGTRFRTAQNLHRQALRLHVDGKSWINLRPENYMRDKWERGENFIRGEVIVP